MISSTIKVCIFDVNGVLIDSNKPNAYAMARAFTEDPVTWERIAALYLELTGIDRGTKIRVIQERIIGRSFEEGEFQRRWDRFTEIGRVAMRNAPLLPGVMGVLEELGRLGVTRVALSNTPPALLKGILAGHGLDALLDIIRGGGDWPKSESLARLLAEFRLHSEKCLFFGDGKGDLAAARSSGVPFVAVDPGTGEFAGEAGIGQTCRSLAEWGSDELGLRGVD